MSAPAAARPTVDPTTLEAPPPPGAVCRADGPWVICETTFLIDLANEPIADFGLPLRNAVRDDLRPSRGHPLVPGRKARQAIRQPERRGHLELVAERRRADRQALLPRQLAERVRRARATSPGQSFDKESSAKAPGFGVITHIAGLDAPDGTYRGVYRFVDDPDVAAELCAALTA